MIGFTREESRYIKKTPVDIIMLRLERKEEVTWRKHKTECRDIMESEKLSILLLVQFKPVKAVFTGKWTGSDVFMAAAATYECIRV